jgi:hypothetical protein
MIERINDESFVDEPDEKREKILRDALVLNDLVKTADGAAEKFLTAHAAADRPPRSLKQTTRRKRK